MRRRLAILGSGLAAVVVIAAAGIFGGSIVLAQQSQAQGQAQTAQDQPYLGIGVANVTPEIKQRLGLSVDQGVVVTQVAPNSPAQAAGLQRGDIIQSVGGTNVSTVQDVTQTVQNAKVGDTLALGINRGGTAQTVSATLAARPSRGEGKPGPLAGLAPGNLADGTLTFVDENGTRTTLNVVAGKVTSASATSLTIEPRGAAGQSRTFDVTNDTRVLGAQQSVQSLQVNDEVVVATKDSSNTAVLVAPHGKNMGGRGHRWGGGPGDRQHPQGTPGAGPQQRALIPPPGLRGA